MPTHQSETRWTGQTQSRLLAFCLQMFWLKFMKTNKATRSGLWTATATKPTLPQLQYPKLQQIIDLIRDAFDDVAFVCVWLDDLTYYVFMCVYVCESLHLYHGVCAKWKWIMLLLPGWWSIRCFCVLVYLKRCGFSLTLQTDSGLQSSTIKTLDLVK